MEQMIDLDCIFDFDEGESEIQRYRRRYPFPTIAFHNESIYLNYFTRMLLKQLNATHLSFASTTNFIIVRPCKGGKNAFKITGEARSTLHIPAALMEKKIRPGVYKLFRYKNDLAFKRYEPLET